MSNRRDHPHTPFTVIRMTAFSWQRILACCILAMMPTPGAGDDTAPIVPAEISLGRPVDFARDLMPILRAKCLACHSSSRHEGNLVLETAERIRTGGDSGPAMVPEKPEESLLYQLAAHRDEPFMPPPGNEVSAASVSSDELGLLRQWILEGGQGSSVNASELVWQSFPGNVQPVYSLALDVSERILAAGRGNKIALIDLSRRIEFAQLLNPNIAGGPRVAHRDFVHSLAFHPAGTLLASGGYRVIYLWNRLESLRERLVAPAAVSALAVSVDGSRVAAGQTNGEIVIWDRTSGHHFQLDAAHATSVSTMFLNESASFLASASFDGVVHLSSATEGSRIATIRTPSPASAALFDETHSQLITGHDDGVIRLWGLPALIHVPSNDAATIEEPLQELSGHGGRVTTLEWVNVESRRLVSASHDGTARIWKLPDSGETSRLEHGQPISNLCVSHDGTRIAVTGADTGIIRIWKAEGEGFQQTTEQSANPLTAREQQRLSDDLQIAQARTSHAATHLDQIAKDIKERDASLAQSKEQLDSAQKAAGEAEGKVAQSDRQVAEAAGQLAEKPDDESLKQRHAEATTHQQQAQEALKKAREAVASAERELELSQRSLEFIQKQKEAAEEVHRQLIQKEQAVRASLDDANSRAAGPRPKITALTFVSDGSLFATGDADGTITICDTQTARPLETFAGHDGGITSLRAGPEGLLFAAGSAGTVTLWDTSPAWRLVGHIGPSDSAGFEVSSSPIEGRVLCLAFSPDGTRLAAGSGVPSRSGQVSIWDIESRSLVKSLEEPHSDTVFDVAYSHDGDLLLTGAADKFAKLFDAQSGTLLRSFEGHTGHVLSVAWQADCSQIATAGADNAVKVWDVRTGEQRRTITSHSKPVTSISFLALTDQIATGSGDETVRLHRTTDGNNFRTLGGAGDFVHSMLVTHAGTHIVAGTESGRIMLWETESGRQLATIDPPPDTRSEPQASIPATGQRIP